MDEGGETVSHNKIIRADWLLNNTFLRANMQLKICVEQKIYAQNKDNLMNRWSLRCNYDTGYPHHTKSKRLHSLCPWHMPEKCRTSICVVDSTAQIPEKQCVAQAKWRV